MYIETTTDEITLRAEIEKDPYVQDKKIVESYELKEFDLHTLKEFQSIANSFLYRV